MTPGRAGRLRFEALQPVHPGETNLFAIIERDFFDRPDRRVAAQLRDGLGAHVLREHGIPACLITGGLQLVAALQGVPGELRVREPRGQPHEEDGRDPIQAVDEDGSWGET